MALATAVQGALRPSQLITWTDADGDAVDLSGATLTGRIRSIQSGTARDIAGTLTITTAAAGEFRWDYAAGDVVDAGKFEVQFTATFGTSPTPARTFVGGWEVERAI